MEAELLKFLLHDSEVRVCALFASSLYRFSSLPQVFPCLRLRCLGCLVWRDEDGSKTTIIQIPPPDVIVSSLLEDTVLLQNF